jgi:magnesium transporter
MPRPGGSAVLGGKEVEEALLNVIAFDFGNKRAEVITASGITAAVAAGRYCWVDAESAPPELVAETAAALGLPAGIAVSPAAAWGDEGARWSDEGIAFILREADARSPGEPGSVLGVLVNERGLLTVHAGPSACVVGMRRAWREDFERHSKTHGFLLYEIADWIVDGYRRGTGAVRVSVEQLELGLFGEADDALFRAAAGLTRRIFSLRVGLTAARELFHELAERRSRFVPESTQPHLALLAGGLDRLAADLAAERDAIAGALNLYMGMVAHHTGQRLKRLTALSAVFLPLTFLTGIYGMNFVHFPEVHWRYGYLFFWGTVAAVAGTLVTLMRRGRWI